MVTISETALSLARAEQERDKYKSQRDDLLKAMKKVYGASTTKNNGAYMGEAVLCQYFETMFKYLIDEVENDN
jgi:hypothetical protein